MDPGNLIVQMAFHLLPFSFSPAVQENPDVVTVRAAKRPVFIPTLIRFYKIVQIVFFLWSAFPERVFNACASYR